MEPLIISAYVELDFYRMRKRFPERIYMEKPASRMGLNSPRGPDPQPYNPALSMTAVAGHSFFGMRM